MLKKLLTKLYNLKSFFEKDEKEMSISSRSRKLA